VEAHRASPVTSAPQPVKQLVGPEHTTVLPGQGDIVAPPVHPPLPSHWVSVVRVPFEHEITFEHAVPVAAFWHAPVVGAQLLVSPQGGEGVQAAAQQTPFVPHTPLVHWSAAVQVAAPVASLGWQCCEASHHAVVMHWASLVQVVVQAPFEQR
jgi:hypothetical protein